ncbi:Putative carboxypeptidase C24C9.08 [Tolypocladium paradoxum]|uniref:Carboxypeptidase C24C9.08 n=1 Tax=Tolypocladium paradoxum TaxID=94208 RepID=A0A2S4L7T7_9HYPO|nr:Putative carboxypeptidase C24C9.08 [Tolypocladium paradoxum]
MALMKLSLLAGVAIIGVAALVPPPIPGSDQRPLSSGPRSSFKCDLPPALAPSRDGLPSATDLFSSEKSLNRQVARHQALVRVPSICYDDLGPFDEDDRWLPFYDVHDVLEDTYPMVHQRATLEKINTFGLLYTIEGSNPDLKPILLAAHQDVVPVADAATWTHPPFDAYFDGEWLWGRGAMDDKDGLTGIMSAMEELLSDPGWKPTRTILLAFGFDEECSGYRGAGTISKHLVERYGENGIAMILDEGGLGLLELGDALYALPAVYEKGHVDIWLELHVVGGHSSIPFPHTGIGIMSQIVNRLEANPYTPKIVEDGPIHRHLQCQARYSPKAVPKLTELVNKGDLGGLAQLMVDARFDLRYLIQTSQAVDIISGGQKINAMPEVVTLGVNYRHPPGAAQRGQVRGAHLSEYGIKVQAFEGDDSYHEFAAKADPDSLKAGSDIDYNGTLVVRKSEGTNWTPISPTDGPIWHVFAGTIRHTFAFEDGTVVPAGQTMTGNTDTRHYLNLTPHIYRWNPIRMGEFEAIHTIDERILMKGHMERVRFYYDLVRNFNAELDGEVDAAPSEL